MQINGDVLSVHLASGGDIHYASDDLVILTTVRSGPKEPKKRSCVVGRVLRALGNDSVNI
jgi:hypothetical protein